MRQCAKAYFQLKMEVQNGQKKYSLMISVMNKLFSVGFITPTGSFSVERLNYSGDL